MLASWLKRLLERRHQRVVSQNEAYIAACSKAGVDPDRWRWLEFPLDPGFDFASERWTKELVWIAAAEKRDRDKEQAQIAAAIELGNEEAAYEGLRKAALEKPEYAEAWAVASKARIEAAARIRSAHILADAMRNAGYRPYNGGYGILGD